MSQKIKAYSRRGIEYSLGFEVERRAYNIINRLTAFCSHRERDKALEDLRELEQFINQVETDLIDEIFDNGFELGLAAAKEESIN
jgi:hypothetical protein